MEFTKGLVNVLVLALSFFLGAAIYQGLNHLANPCKGEAIGISGGIDSLYISEDIYDTAQRVWLMSDFGIRPNTGICYSEKVQRLVDSAYNLPGVTELKFTECGEYHMSLMFDMREKESNWIKIIFCNSGAMSMSKCPKEIATEDSLDLEYDNKEWYKENKKII